MTGGSGKRYGDQGYDGQWYENQPYEAQAYEAQGYDRQGYGPASYDSQEYNGHGVNGQGYGARWPGGQDQGQGQGYADQPTRQYEGYADQSAPQYGGYADQSTRQYDGYTDQPTRQERYRDQRGDQGHGYNGQAYNGQAYEDQAYNGQAYNGQAYNGQAYNGQAYNGQAYNGQAYEGQGQAYEAQRYDSQGYAEYNGYTGQHGYAGEGYGAERGRPGRDAGPRPPGQRKVRFRRLRGFSRRRSVRVVAAVVGVFLVWVTFSAGQAAFKNNGQGFTANLAEWARDHYLGPIVTFGEWLSYNPPKSGGKPSFSYAVPKGEQVTQTRGRHSGFVPDIPPTVKLLASGPALPGEGQWRVIEKVKGEPAILITFLRDGGQYTSYSNGIASIDQRLVKFSLRPGTEDPGSAPGDGGNWGVADYIPPGQRAGVLATFNGGFKLDSAGGGFYLNGMYHGSLVNGAASIVYYKNGTVKIGQWGRDFRMNSSIEGVRQNLSLLVDHGEVSPNANSAVKTGNWGATLGGGYWVWRSGIGITRDGRIVFVYGQALDAQDLGKLLKQAGAVEGMQMDINPEWMKFDYYQSNGHPSDPTPVPLLPNQQASPYSYYTPSTRDFTAVYAR